MSSKVADVTTGVARAADVLYNCIHSVAKMADINNPHPIHN